MSWQQDIFEQISAHNIRFVAHVPDAAHSQLLKSCASCAAMQVVGLTTEQDGIGLLSGAWAGGEKGVLLMQSSGVGNVVNALALANVCRIPLLMIVSMRGEWGEFIPWQVPMGQATQQVLEAMGVMVYRATTAHEVGATVDAAANFAFNTRQASAVLLSQRLIGAKQFTEG